MEKLTFAILFAKACVLLMKKSNMTYIILRIPIIKGFCYCSYTKNVSKCPINGYDNLSVNFLRNVEV